MSVLDRLTDEDLAHARDLLARAASALAISRPGLCAQITAFLSRIGGER